MYTYKVQYYQEPITQREGALNLCMYVDSTCCLIALVQNSLYSKLLRKRYNSLSISIVLSITAKAFHIWSFLVGAILTTGEITTLINALEFWAPDITHLIYTI